jgi:8-oxo-dGTP pyrophosphatase MutT (NUDIX family)
VLVRESGDNPELLLMRRHQRSAFGGAHAFPGGVLEDADSLVADQCAGITPDDADAMLGVDHGLAYFSAAIRELFEESGVLLATIGRRGVNLNAARDGLNDGTLDWRSFVADNDVRLHCDTLQYFSFWITPEALPRRFSTRFFLAAMPEDQDAGHCGGELAERRRCTRRASRRRDIAALSDDQDTRGARRAPHARRAPGVGRGPDELLEWAAARAREGVPCIFPEIEKRRGEARVIVAGRDSGALE